MLRQKPAEPQKKLAITFYSKQKVTCPICKETFEKEELLSGGGRLIAGDLTDELRRTYEPSAKYGTIYPIIYNVAACQKCNSAFFWQDFETLNNPQVTDKLWDTEKKRKKSIETVFPHYNFKHNRTLLDGAAAYYAALLCYEELPAAFSPTIKKAVISLRLAWICSDLNKVCPNYNYDFMSTVFYKKALFFYQEALIKEMGREENIMNIASHGPDTDKNYGYDGVIYLNAILEYKYGQKEDIQARLKKLDENKRAIARIFGLGKSSKNKPGPLLEHSRNIYDTMTAELKDANIPDIDDDVEELVDEINE